MSDNTVLDTLFLPFENGSLTWQGQTLFLYADWHAGLQPCDVLQIDKAAVDRLTAHGFENLPYLQKTYHTILIQVPKQVQEAQGIIALAIDHLDDNGVLVLAADNDANGKRLLSWLEDAGLPSPVSESKNRARVAWAEKPAGLKGRQDWLAAASVRPVDGYFTRPGLFSWDSPDTASRLLVDHLPSSLSGAVADFGCGWGYLSRHVLKECAGLTTLLMIDADSRALPCAVANTEHLHPSCKVIPVWHDLTRPLPESVPALDAIIMNPPFHTGKKTDLDLGQSFIRTASAALKRGGILYMVANSHLRYEEELGKLFKTVESLAQKNGFKVIRAVK